MTGRLLALDLLATLLVAALWAGVLGCTLAGRSRAALALLAAAVLGTVLRAGIVGALAGSGWWFVQEKVLLTLPLVALPGGVAAVLAGPPLVRAWSRGDAPEVGRPALAALGAAAGGGVAGVVSAFALGYPVTAQGALVLLLCALVPAALTLSGGRAVRVGTSLAATVVLISAGAAWWSSRLPDRLDMSAHAADLGGASNGTNGHHHGGVSVADLRGPSAPPDQPVRRFTLTARHADVPLAGHAFHAWTFDGQVPGPQLRVRQGDLVEVTLRNAGIADGVTLHWHGYPVPGGEDGVAGVTQDAVPPGGEFVYRFRADQPGTYWYHSHQRSAEQVALGLFGALVVEPRDTPPALDLVIPVHTLGGALLTGAVDGLDQQTVPPGTPVRLRLINTDDSAHLFALRGTTFRLAAIDGSDIDGAQLAGQRLSLGAGGRYDLVFTMPRTPVQLATDGRDDRGLLLQPNSADGARLPGPDSGPLLDVTRYGTPQPLPGRFDRDFTLVLDRQLRFLDGLPRYAYTVGGQVYPDIPSHLVHEGELVRFTVVNRGLEAHPMHPHGHRVQVLSRNGVPATGAVWTDSFDVGPGEVWQVALRADNPGIWMDHCHNLEHAADGMVMHLVYEGVHTPYTVGRASRNHPE